MRNKKEVSELVLGGTPFVYTSGKYASEYEKTTVVAAILPQPNQSGALVYDLRHDPEEFLQMSPNQLVERWQYTRDEAAPPRLPVKTLQFNRCPAVAPLSVLRQGDTQARLGIDLAVMTEHLETIQANPDFIKNIQTALDMMNKQRQVEFASAAQSVDSQLYDGFFDQHDSQLLAVVRAAEPKELADFEDELHDPRLRALLPLYQARNYPASLSQEQRAAWDEFCRARLQSGATESRLAKFATRLQELGARTSLTKLQRFLLEELQLYAESIVQIDPDI
jgi:exodeoxyribonuclease-1